MGFRFSLATLLRIREIAEQREERLLGQIEQEIAQHRKTLVDLALQRERMILQREEALLQSTSAVDLINSHVRVAAIRELEASGRDQLAKLTALREKQMKIYQTAHRNSELLAGMRDDQRLEYDKSRIKQDQAAMDDNFSSRLRFK